MTSAIDPEIIQNQATINVGTLGHVSHGKSTLVEAISGVRPMRFKKELENSSTIKLGYTGFKIYQCDTCAKPEAYRSYSSSNQQLIERSCPLKTCSGTERLVRHFSFVDCPGHESYMATMLNGAAVMDVAILVIAGNQRVPQPQTEEHLSVADMLQINPIFTVQSKIDLLSEQEARSHKEKIEEFEAGTIAEKSPIIPMISTPKYKINQDILLQYLVEKVPLPEIKVDEKPLMSIVRSFDVNKPGQAIEKLIGGCAGGTIKKGSLKIGDQIEIRPGLIFKDDEDNLLCQPFITRISSLQCDQNQMAFAVSGGLVAVGTDLDPFFTKGDRLKGQILGFPGHMPEIFQKLEIQLFLFKRAMGLEEKKKIRLEKNETIRINSGSLVTEAVITALEGKMCRINLKMPICLEIGEKVSISKSFNRSWRLIGGGTFLRGKLVKLKNYNEVIIPCGPVTN